jgi:hypothetical protein
LLRESPETTTFQADLANVVHRNQKLDGFRPILFNQPQKTYKTTLQEVVA